MMNDTSNESDLKKSELHYFYTALMFYTRIPVPANTPYSKDILNRSRAYFPLIGIIIGAIGGLTFLISQLFFVLPLSVALSMVATILATGAFHEDGFADSCDGLGGGWNTEQVLTIMKDSRLGTYGSIGLMAILGIKFLALTELANTSLTTITFCMIGAHCVSRLFASLAIDSYSYVQDSETSKAKPVTDSRLNSPDLHASFIFTAFPLLLLGFVAFIPTVIAVLGASLLAKLFGSYSGKRIGGVTGDILGAIQQLSELAFYLSFIALI